MDQLSSAYSIYYHNVQNVNVAVAAGAAYSKIFNHIFFNIFPTIIAVIINGFLSKLLNIVVCM